ncbi:MAG: hypothetical protein AB7K24_01165 [Gemmataceae bacterium]
MGLPKKSTRRLSLNARVYRWLVSPNDGYIVVYVELAEEPGQRLEAYFAYHDILEAPRSDGGQRIIGQRRKIGSGVVRELIEAGLKRGWEPAQKGLPPFRIYDTDQIAPIDS